MNAKTFYILAFNNFLCIVIIYKIHYQLMRFKFDSALTRIGKQRAVTRKSEENAEEDESYLYDTLEAINLRLDKLENGGGTELIKTAVNQLILVVNQIKQYFGILWVIVYFVVNWITGVNPQAALGVLQGAGMDVAMTNGQFSVFQNLTGLLS